MLIKNSLAVKATIAQTLTQYENDAEVDEVLLWEMIKLEIRATSIKYSKIKMKGMRKIEDTIESEITSLERQLECDSGNNKVALAEQLKLKKKELESIIEYKTKGAIIRSKARWYNEGEKNSKYFLNLENRHCKRKTIVQIKGNNGSYLTNDSDILEECNSFYGSLYTSRTSATVNRELENLFLDQELPKLTDDDKQKCEGLLTAKECLEAVKLMESGKSPGTDGLPAEFYKVFWNDISPYLVSSLNRSYQKGKLAITQRRGIISLIPKKDKALDELKHWRPLTLLNCDYKIASKAIASRLKTVLPGLIDNDQTGFLKGRSITENICLINNVISYTETKNIPGMLLFVDFEKAFDTIEWSFVCQTLLRFGFGTSFIKWINVFYCGIQSCVVNNGWSSPFFELGRGVRQGCPLSPYIFILCAEILAIAVRKDTTMKGISIGNVECKLSQFADDTALILDGSLKSLQRSLYMLERFGEISGLRVNWEKTEVLWIGSLKGSKQILCPEKNLTWANSKVKSLGVWFCVDQEEGPKKNYEEKALNVANALNNWHNKRLTLIGKIAIIKALAASLWYMLCHQCLLT